MAITTGVDADTGLAVWDVCVIDDNGKEVSSFKGFPIEFGAKRSMNEKDGLTKLKKSIVTWAEKNGYKAASI